MAKQKQNIHSAAMWGYGMYPEDLSKAMNDREKWRERIRDIFVLAARHDDDDEKKKLSQTYCISFHFFFLFLLNVKFTRFLHFQILSLSLSIYRFLSFFLLSLHKFKAHGVMVIVVGNGHGDASSNPGRDWLHFT